MIAPGKASENNRSGGTMGAPFIAKTIACAVLAAAATGAWAQTYPSRPIRLVIPFPPGGGADISSRIIGKALTDRLGVQFVYDNRPGASTIIATEIAARSNPDGYTILMSTATHSINPNVFAKRPFDEIADFTPIVLVSDSPNMLAVNTQLPIKTMKDVVAYAKSNPGKFTYGTGGHGTHQHMAMELFRVRAGIDVLHVPYKGGVPAVTDAIGGQIMATMISQAALAPYVKQGRLRALGVTGAKRSLSFPDVPTVAEQGFPGYVSSYWLGFMGPAKLPPAIVTLLNKEVNAALGVADVRDQFVVQGADPAGGTQAEFAERVKREIGEWADVVKAIGMKPQ